MSSRSRSGSFASRASKSLRRSISSAKSIMTSKKYDRMEDENRKNEEEPSSASVGEVPESTPVPSEPPQNNLSEDPPKYDRENEFLGKDFILVDEVLPNIESADHVDPEKLDKTKPPLISRFKSLFTGGRKHNRGKSLKRRRASTGEIPPAACDIQEYPTYNQKFRRTRSAIYRGIRRSAMVGKRGCLAVVKEIGWAGQYARPAPCFQQPTFGCVYVIPF